MLTDDYRPTYVKEKEVPTRRIVNARIVQIQSVAKPVLAALVMRQMVDDEGRDMFVGPRPAVDSVQFISFADARKKWLTEMNNKLSVADANDSNSLKAFMDGAGPNASNAELMFDVERELVFERTAKSMRLKADCHVEYDLNDQESAAIQTAAPTDEGGDDDEIDTLADMDDDELYGRAPTKKTKLDAAPRASAVKQPPRIERVQVTGIWPTLSSGVALSIVVKDECDENGARITKSRLDATEIAIYHDKTCAEAPRVSLRDLARVMRHAAGFHDNHIKLVLRSLFPTIYAPDQPVNETPGACRSTVRLSEPLVPLTCTVEIAELLAAIAKNKEMHMNRLIDGVLFPGTTTLFFYRREIATIVEYYGARRAVDIVARGGALVSSVYALLTSRPHVLCFARLKQIEFLAQQKSIDEEKEYAASAGAQTPEELAAAQRDRTERSAAMRWLSTMPELGVAAYRTLVARFASTHSTSPEIRELIDVAVDIYASIVKHDQFSGDDKDFRDARRNGRGATSGHVFSVFGAGAHTRVPSDKYDSGFSDGTLCLDEVFAAGRRARVLAANQAPAPPPTTTPNKPCSKRPRSGEQDDFLPAILPSRRVPLAVIRDTLTPAAPAPCVADELRDDIARLTRPCTADQFCNALQWLCRQSILVNFTNTGTGPVNRGRRFDAFYTAEMWSTQLTLCEILTDVYRRALTERLLTLRAQRDGQPAVACESIDDINGDIAFRERARAHLREIARNENQRILLVKRLRLAKAISGSRTDFDAHATACNNSLYAEQTEQLNACVDEFIKRTTPAELEAERATDCYADMLASSEHRLARESDARVEEVLRSSNLSEEQKDGIRHVLHNGVTIFMSPGGCGKTRAVEVITKLFPLDQIAICALTGKACEVLQKLVGKVSTIHSLLVRETLHRQATARHVARLTRLATAGDDALFPGENSRKIREAMARVQLELESKVGMAESKSPLDNIRLLIVDETSLVDEELMRRLLEVVHPLTRPNSNAPGKRALMRVLFLGDVEQLGSIEPGSFLQTLCRAFPHCVRTFTKNFRSKGTAIFKLARSIVLRKPSALEVDFDIDRNERRLRRSIVPANNSPAEIAAAEDASLVFINSNDRALQGDLRRTLGLLGAFSNQSPPSTAVLAMRDAIHIIAPTNYVVNQCNALCRELYFGKPMPGDDTRRYVLAAPALYHKVLRSDRIFFRQNNRIQIEVDKAALIEAAEYDLLNGKATTSESERARLLALTSGEAANMAPGEGVLGDDDADARLDDTPHALLTERGVEEIRQLDARMYEVGHALGDDGKRRVLVKFFNSEILNVMDFYDRTVPAAGFRALCVCGKCSLASTNQDGGGGGGVLHKERPCVRWPHVVPPLRRMLGDLTPAARISYHDHNASLGGAAKFERLVVFRTSTGAFKQLNVATDMHERSAWEFAWATTVHRYQGSGGRIIVIAIPRDSAFADLRMLYTAVTRGEERVIFVGSPETWRAVASREPPLRRTELWYLLAQSIAAAHRRVAEVVGLSSPDGSALADALTETGTEQRALLNTNATPAEESRETIWRRYTTINAETLRRAGLLEM